MRKILVNEFQEVKKTIESEPFVVVQWDCDLCTPCKVQSEIISQQNYPFPMFSVPVCNKSKSIDNYLEKIGARKVIPGITVFVNGKPSKFNDVSLLGTDSYGNKIKSDHLYGQRNNINDFLLQMYKKYVNQKELLSN